MKLVEFKKVTGNSAKLNCRGGTSDSRFLGSIPRLELGLRNDKIHQINESVKICDRYKEFWIKNDTCGRVRIVETFGFQ